ncbi:MAG: hypothetical protein IZT57_03730, partial [Chloroflexi bacterium]|nr:hypothetical protein [Chloroflexota bacterium]
MIIDSLFPIAACLIALMTPKGLYKTLNEVLAALFIFVFAVSYLGQASDTAIYDGVWYDITMLLLYSVCGAVFYFIGGRVQSILCSAGAIIITIYAALWINSNESMLFFYSDPENNVRYEVLISLYTIQLLAAFRGMSWSLLCKIKHGGYNGIRSAHGGLW